ncbi:hypothetical protein [Xenorhabdus bovienii]|uniref:hypothetical protein n=1 Tax=Xenorhabdus bovienii TaxID=40576 RepID=UPI0039B3F59B
MLRIQFRVGMFPVDTGINQPASRLINISLRVPRRYGDKPAYGTDTGNMLEYSP